MIQIVEIEKSLKPMFTTSKGELIACRGSKIYLKNECSEYECIGELPIRPIQRFLSRWRLFQRLLRLEVYSAISFGSDYFFCFGGFLYRLDTRSGLISEEHRFKKGNGPLSFTVIEGLEGFVNGIYFGEYIGDSNFNESRIFKRGSDGNWEIIFTFNKGVINHIHSLVPNPRGNNVFIFTGDHGPNSGIYIAHDNFSRVEPYRVGKQDFRSVVSYVLNEHLIISTDSPYDRNHIYGLHIESGEIMKIANTINGPVIYGCEVEGYLIFCTAVEPPPPRWPVLHWLDVRKAKGIVANKIDIVAVQKQTLEARVIFSLNKDNLPSRLFQFGSAFCLRNSALVNSFFLYPTATKMFDGVMLQVQMDPGE